MSEQYLRGQLGWKGERGYSAYEIACQNGFIGTEKDWLAQLGTSAHFMKDSVVHIATGGQTGFALPEGYTSNSQVDVHIEGFKLPYNKYVVNTETLMVELMEGLDEGTEVEVVVLRMTTVMLPIGETVSEHSTNEVAARI